jgi:hypothetical protein
VIVFEQEIEAHYLRKDVLTLRYNVTATETYYHVYIKPAKTTLT